MRLTGLPIVSEAFLMSCLVEPLEAGTISAIQNGCFLSVIDCFDRKIDRAYFLNVMTLAFSVYAQSSRLAVCGGIQQLLAQKKLTPEMLGESMAKLIANTSEKQVKLIALMEQVVICPTSEDTKH